MTGGPTDQHGSNEALLFFPRFVHSNPKKRHSVHHNHFEQQKTGRLGRFGNGKVINICELCNKVSTIPRYYPPIKTIYNIHSSKKKHTLTTTIYSFSHSPVRHK